MTAGLRAAGVTLALGLALAVPSGASAAPESAGAAVVAREPADAQPAAARAMRTIRYRIEYRGRIRAKKRIFAAQVAETLRDRRGWRGAGIRFQRVRRGGAMSVVLAAAGRVPGFSSGCSAAWSCRVGRYVVINQRRWRFATKVWNDAGRTRRGYRHMVVNHEVGHFLGLGHASCGGPGRRAPVMMAQSKGLGGCRFNAWPLPSERRAVG